VAKYEKIMRENEKRYKAMDDKYERIINEDNPSYGQKARR
jgi:hypothetical protein